MQYLSSGGKQDTTSSGESEPSDLFDSSDDEPLSKYTTPKSNEKAADPEEPGEMSAKPKRGVGRPKGRAQPPHIDFSRPTSIQQHNVRRDRVDEECERLGIYYRRWRPLNPEQTEHVSVREFSDDTIIPEEQPIPQWCIMCPKNRYMRNRFLTKHHYLRVHHKAMLVVEDKKMWACKCSEMRSHGSDNSARNRHFHCYICFHPFKTADLLGTHLVTQHLQVNDASVRHLMDENNPHKERF